MTEVAKTETTDSLATPGPAALAPSAPMSAGVVQLHDWAAELDAAHRIGSLLAHSNFLPKSLRERGKGIVKPIPEMANDAAAVILAGKSVGLDPMQSVQNIFPVHGAPSMYARTMVALVIAEGHEVVRKAAANDSVTYAVRRKGGDWQDFTWTIGRAQKAGYTNNEKYTKDPIAMLGAKAAAEACRTVFPDVLLGMAYSVEDYELEDMGESAPAPTAAAPAPKADAKRKVTRKAAPVPKLPDDVNNAPKDEEPAEAEQIDPELAEEFVNQTTGELPAEETPAVLEVDYFEEILAKTGDVTALRTLWKQASADGQDTEVLDAIASAATAAKN